MVACSMVSCGVPKERKVTVANVDITGLIKNYVKVVDGDYMFTNDGDEAFITVKFELTNPLVGSEIGTKGYRGLRINPMGSSGEIFDTGTYGFEASDTETAKLVDLINTGTTGDTKSVSFKWDYFSQGEDLRLSIFEKSVTFEVVDETFCYPEQSSSESSASISNVSDSSNDWDSVLDDYEKYIDEYIKLCKKMADGDMSAMSSYTEMVDMANSWGEKLSRAEGSLSASQMSRYLKLNEKFTNALANMN